MLLRLSLKSSHLQQFLAMRLQMYQAHKYLQTWLARLLLRLLFSIAFGQT